MIRRQINARAGPKPRNNAIRPTQNKIKKVRWPDEPPQRAQKEDDREDVVPDLPAAGHSPTAISAGPVG
jgi:hypothetical protein